MQLWGGEELQTPGPLPVPDLAENLCVLARVSLTMAKYLSTGQGLQMLHAAV